MKRRMLASNCFVYRAAQEEELTIRPAVSGHKSVYQDPPYFLGGTSPTVENGILGE